MAASDFTPTKCCSKCGVEYPATSEYFYKIQSGNLRNSCKKCRDAYVQEWCEDNRPRRREIVNRWDDNHPEQIAKWRDEHREYLLNYHRNYYIENRDILLIKGKEWVERNPEKSREIKSRHYQNHTPIVKARSKKWRQDHPERYALSMRVCGARRRSRRQKLPDSFTNADWRRALEYFHHCCAVCGRQLKDLFDTHTAAADHWIPLSYDGENPGTVPTNIVPLCHGENGCNNSKTNKLPDEWLIQRFGKRKAKQVMKRVQEYFEWVALNE